MAEVFDLEQINAALEEIDVIQYIEEGFVAYSRGEVVVPPIGEMVFDEGRGGQVHGAPTSSWLTASNSAAHAGRSSRPRGQA